MNVRPRTLRGRLTLVFAVVTLLVSALGAGFVLVRYHSDLSNQVDENLEIRYADVRATLRRTPSPTPSTKLAIIPRAEVFAQVLTPTGRILAASPRALDDRPVLGPRQLATAAAHRTTVERAVPPQTDRARLLAGPEQLGSTRVVVVVGASLDDNASAQAELELALAITLPTLALIVIGACWLLVGAALRPVRAMVSEADALSVRHRGQRLSVRGPAEVAELARRLNDMLARIEGALDHERAFLDDASHELRTPIAITRGELELARPLAVGHPEVRDAIDSALEEVDRLEVLALNLLVLARTRAAGPPPEQRVDVRPVCEQALEDVRRTRDLGDIELSARGAACVLGDATAIERAVTNLVDNAVRHATRTVVVNIEQVAGESLIEVRDDGPGFPSTLLDRANERFVRGATGGAGLGLAIVDAIVAAHGGRLELSNGSSDEAGGVARLRLPACG